MTEVCTIGGPGTGAGLLAGGAFVGDGASGVGSSGAGFGVGVMVVGGIDVVSMTVVGASGVGWSSELGGKEMDEGGPLLDGVTDIISILDETMDDGNDDVIFLVVFKYILVLLDMLSAQPGAEVPARTSNSSVLQSMIKAPARSQGQVKTASECVSSGLVRCC